MTSVVGLFMSAYTLYVGFPGGSAGKESGYNAGDPADAGSIPSSGRHPGGGKWRHSPGFLPGKSRGQRGLQDHNLWGLREADTTDARALIFTIPLQCAWITVLYWMA